MALLLLPLTLCLEKEHQLITPTDALLHFDSDGDSMIYQVIVVLRYVRMYRPGAIIYKVQSFPTTFAKHANAAGGLPRLVGVRRGGQGAGLPKAQTHPGKETHLAFSDELPY